MSWCQSSSFPDPDEKVKIRRDGGGTLPGNRKMAVNLFCEIVVEEALRVREKHGGGGAAKNKNSVKGTTSYIFLWFVAMKGSYTPVRFSLRGAIHDCVWKRREKTSCPP